MPAPIDFSIANSEQIESALCQQIVHIRLARNLTQAQLAAQAGVSLKTITRLEKGQGISLDTFIRVLAALGLQDNLETLLPDPTIRPMERTRSAGKERLRARPPRRKKPAGAWKWGDETSAEESR